MRLLKMKEISIFGLSRKVFSGNPACPETHSVEQADLELMEICLSCLESKVRTSMPGVDHSLENVPGRILFCLLIPLVPS